MKTYMAKAENLERKWFVIDAAGKPLGRVASRAAAILKGKHKPIYTPHVDTGDNVIVVNVEKAILTGNKLNSKIYYRHTGHPGGIKEVKYGDLMQNKPEFALEKAVKGMLPKNSLGRKMIKKLKVYAGPDHNHQAQMPEKLDI